MKLKLGSTPGNLSSAFANNKGADQPAHSCSLISAFVIRNFESIIYIYINLAIVEISILLLVSVADETGFSLALSETLKTGFCRIEAQLL